MKNKRIKKLVYFIVVVAILIFLMFNDNGIIRYLSIKSEINELNSQIHEAQKKINSLKSEIDSLNSNLFKIEKVAREKYHMLDKNEQALKVEEKRQN